MRIEQVQPFPREFDVENAALVHIETSQAEVRKITVHQVHPARQVGKTASR